MLQFKFHLRLACFFVILGVSFFISPQTIFAATRTWDGGGTDGTCGGGAGDGNKWSCAANWSADTVPGATDTATFDGTSAKDATIDTAFSILTLNINSGYTGTIMQSADLTLGSTGNFTHNTVDGKFQWTAGTLSFIGSNNNWDVDSGDDIFGNVNINKSVGGVVTIVSGDTAVVTGTLTLTEGNINTGTLEARGDIAHTATFDGGTGTLSITQGSSDINLVDGGQLPAVNLTANRTINGPATGAVTVDGGFTISNGVFVGGAGNLDLNGTTNGLTIVSPAAFTAPSGTLFVAADFIHTDASVFDANGGTVTFDGANARTIDVNVSETFNNLTWNLNTDAGRNIVAGDTLVVNGTLSLVEGSANLATIEAHGDVLHGAGFDGGSSLLNVVSGSSDINLTAGGQMPLFTLAAGRTVNGPASGTVVFDGAVAISSGSLIGAAGNLDLNGTFSLSGTGTFTASSGTTFLAGSWTHTDSSIFNHNSGTFEIDSNANSPIDVNVTETFNNLTYNTTGAGGRNLVSGDTLIVLGTLSLTSGRVGGTGTVEARGNITQAAAFSGGAGTITFGNDALAQTYTVNGGVGPTIRFDAAADANDSLVFTAAATMTGLTTTSSFSGVIPITNSGDFPLTFTSWSQAAGTYDASAQSSWSFSDFDRTSAAGSFTPPTLVTATGSSQSWAITGDQQFTNITLNKTTANLLTLATAGSSLTVDGTLTLTDGGLAVSTTGSMVVKGDVAGVATFDGSAVPIIFSGTATQSLSLAGATGVLNADMTVNKSGGQVNLLSDLVLDAASQDFNLVEGVFNLNGHNFSVNGSAGTMTVEDGGNLSLQGAETLTFNASNPTLQSDSTVTYTGDGDAGADSYTITTLSSTYGNLAIASTDGAIDIFQLAAPVVLDGDLNLTSGTFDVTSSNRAILAHGDWNNTGTFNHHAGTVTFNGPDHALSGTTTFYDFSLSTSSPSTLTLPAGLTQTFTHNLMLTGASGSLLSLRSSIPGTKAGIDPQGTRTLQYLDVEDNDNVSLLAADCVSGCVNGGNNENWIFRAGTGGGGIFAPTNISVKLPGCTASSTVAVELTGTNVREYLLSEDPDFIGVDWGAFSPQSNQTMVINFALSSGDGEKIVYARFKSSTATQSGTYVAEINLDQANACLAPAQLPVIVAPAPGDFSACQDRVQFSDDLGILKAGSTLLKFVGSSAVYVIENDSSNPAHRILRWLTDENVANLNFGPHWNKYVLELPEMGEAYSLGEPITTQEHAGNVEGMYARAALTGAVSYELAIVTPDGVRRDSASNFARHSTNSQGLGTYFFEDKTDFDYNDVVLMLDPSDCLTYRVTALPVEARLHSQVWLRIFWEGLPEADVLVFTDSQDAVSSIATINVANGILMNEPVKIELKNSVNSQLFRPLSFVRSLWRRFLSLR